LDTSVAELVYGQPLLVPGEFVPDFPPQPGKNMKTARLAIVSFKEDFVRVFRNSSQPGKGKQCTPHREGRGYIRPKYRRRETICGL
jgi:hypothetical protein